MKKLLFSMLICAVALLGACKDPVPTPPTPPTPESATFFTFTIKKADNSGLTEDLIFTAGEDGVFTCKVPYFINRSSLIPSFTVPVGCFVVAQSKTQISGKTAVNFSQPVVYTIKTSDGKSAAVTVKLDIGYAGLSGLPVVVINTEQNQAIKDKDTWIPAKMLIDDGKGNVAFAEADAEADARRRQLDDELALRRRDFDERREAAFREVGDTAAGVSRIVDSLRLEVESMEGRITRIADSVRNNITSLADAVCDAQDKVSNIRSRILGEDEE